MDKKLYEPKYFDIAKQVKFLDLGETQEDGAFWQYGIAYGDDIICGCCGAVFSIEEIFEDWNDFGKNQYPDVEAPIEIYDYWVPLNNEIKGD